MIVFNLACSAGHAFEGWFASPEAFDQQLQCGQLACPHCDSRTISKRPAALAIRSNAPTTAPTSDAATRLMLHLRQLAGRAEDVGTGFAAEARRIHHGEADERLIKGRASAAEVGELIEEGIGVLPVPPAPKNLH